MSILVQYFGILAESTGLSEESIEKTGSKSQVLDFLLDQHPALKKLNFVVSHNGVIVHEDTQINSGDKLSLIPPAPGG